MLSKHTGGRCTESGKRHTPEQGGLACRQYRIPIKAALNGTAGAHMLKVVISPAEATANLRAAEYGYGVPGLTQPGKPSSACAMNGLFLPEASRQSSARFCIQASSSLH